MTALPRLALRLHGGQAPSACVELAAAADRAGFATVWFAENPFGRGVLPAMAACAAATRRTRLGIGVFNPYNRHPTLIAMETAALDELAGGRVVLGLGAGIGARVRQTGLAYRPLGAMRDTFAIVRGLLAGREVTHAGGVFSAERVRLEHPPARPDLPILMAAMGDQALALTGELADGLMISNGCARGYTTRAVALMGEGAARAGRPAPAEVVQYVVCALRADGAEARRTITPVLGRMLLGYWRSGGDSPAVRAAHVGHTGIAPDDYRAAMERLAAGAPAAEALDDRFVDAYTIAGTLDECLARCAAYRAAGVTELGLWFAGDEPVRDLERLGHAARAAGSLTARPRPG
jgi:5,10-methylenetetrahydromethanopterin reductase